MPNRPARLPCSLLLAAPPAAAEPRRQAPHPHMRAAGAHSSAYVVERDQRKGRDRLQLARTIRRASSRRTPSSSPRRRRSPATAVTARSARRCSATSEPAREGVWHGHLYLRGGGDPTSAAGASHGAIIRQGATVERLAALIEDTGIERVTGRVYGDESRLRLTPRRPRLALRNLDLGRPVERPGLQPRPRRRGALFSSTRRCSRPPSSTRRSSGAV